MTLKFAITVKGDRKNGVTYVKFKRFLQTNEPINDIAIPLDREISVIGAIGPLNARFEANAHAHTPDDYTVDDIKIDFSSKGEHSCSSSLYNRKTDEQIVKPWPSRTIIDENVITARIGPTGGKRGYTAITGHPSWGVSKVVEVNKKRNLLKLFQIDCLVLEQPADSRSLC